MGHARALLGITDEITLINIYDQLVKENMSVRNLEKIVKTIGRFDKKIRDNAGGAFNHALFWKLLTPNEQAEKDNE